MSTIKPNLEEVFKSKEEHKEDINEALRLLTLKKDANDTLDLLTNLTPVDIMYIIKLRIVNGIYFKGLTMAEIIDNIDLNYRSLLISLNRSGRKDIKEIHSYDSLASLLIGGDLETDRPKGLTERALDKLKIQR